MDAKFNINHRSQTSLIVNNQNWMEDEDDLCKYKLEYYNELFLSSLLIQF